MVVTTVNPLLVAALAMMSRTVSRVSKMTPRQARRYMGKQSMLNGVVLGGVGRLMGDANLDALATGLSLQVLLEDLIASAITAPAIAQQQQGGGVRILLPPLVGPPVMHRIIGKFGGIAVGANLEKALILAQVI